MLAPDDLLVSVEAAVLTAAEALASAVKPGGAAVGRVVDTGAAARHRMGERVLVGPVQACFECDVCRRGHPAVCPRRVRLGVDVDGALAGQVVARARATTGLVGLLAEAAPGPEAALLAREAPLAYEMLVRAGVAPGDVTIWVGGGPVAALGERLAIAKGATVATEAAGGLPPRVFEVSGRPEERARAAALCGPGAMLVLLAASAAGIRETVAIPGSLLDHDVTIVGVAGAHPDLVPELCALVARREVDLAGLAPVRPWAEAPELLQTGSFPVIVARG